MLGPLAARRGPLGPLARMPIRGVPTENLTLDLDPQMLTLANNDPVLTWTDQSGLGNHAVSGGAAHAVFKTNVVNGRSVVRFDGPVSSAFLSTPELASRTIYAVVNHGDGAAFSEYRRVLDSNDTLGWSIFGLLSEDAYNWRTGSPHPRGISPANAFVNGVNTASALPLATHKLISAVADVTNNWNIWVGNDQISRGQPLIGDIARVLIYSVAHDVSARQSIESILMSTYAIV